MNKAIEKSKTAALMLALLAALALPAAAQEQAAEKEKVAKPSTSAYRVEFAIHESEDGKRVNTRSYSSLVGDKGSSRVRAGVRTPITTGAGVQYMDVGVKLDCQLFEREGGPWLSVKLELSSFAQVQESKDPPLVRNIQTEAEAVVSLGKPTIVNSVEDPVSKRRYELEVTVTKVK